MLLSLLLTLYSKFTPTLFQILLTRYFGLPHTLLWVYFLLNTLTRDSVCAHTLLRVLLAVHSGFYSLFTQVLLTRYPGFTLIFLLVLITVYTGFTHTLLQSFPT